jgi:hypothetical protein
LIDITCWPSLQNLLDSSEFTRIACAAFQACLEDKLLENHMVKDEEAMVECLGELSNSL